MSIAVDVIALRTCVGVSPRLLDQTKAAIAAVCGAAAEVP